MPFGEIGDKMEQIRRLVVVEFEFHRNILTRGALDFTSQLPSEFSQLRKVANIFLCNGSARLSIVGNTTATVRKATEDDVPAIVAVHRDTVVEVNSKTYPPATIEEWLAEITEDNVRGQFDNSIWIVAEDKGKVVGFGQYSLDAGEIYQINVPPDLAGKGYGRAIYDHIENDFIAHKAHKISLNSTLNAVDFYKKMGFKPTGKIDFKLDSETVEMVKMEKLIAN